MDAILHVLMLHNMIKLIKWKPKHTIWKVIVIVIAILLSLLLIFFTSFLFVSIESTRGLI